MTALNNEFFESFFETGLDSFDDEAFETVSYQGFDPKLIRKELIRRKWTQKELTYILTFFLVRGTNIDDKNEGKNTAEFNKMIAGLKNKGLVLRANGNKDITINRIVACMPEIVAGIIAKYHDKCRILCIDTSPDIPIYLKFSSGGALCESDVELEHWINWATEQDKVINPGKNDCDRVRQFALIQYNSGFITETKRNDIRLNLDGLLSTNPWITKCTRRLSINSDNLLTKVISELSKTKELKKEVQKLIADYVAIDIESSSDDNYYSSEYSSDGSYEDFTGFSEGNPNECFY